MFTVLTENQSSSPSTHSMHPTTASSSRSGRFNVIFWPLQVPVCECTHVHLYTHKYTQKEIEGREGERDGEEGLVPRKKTTQKFQEVLETVQIH